MGKPCLEGMGCVTIARRWERILPEGELCFHGRIWPKFSFVPFFLQSHQDKFSTVPSKHIILDVLWTDDGYERDKNQPEVNFISNTTFSRFKATLDSRMKELQNSGKYQVRKAKLTSYDQENMGKGTIGWQLLDSLVYYIGLYFALHSGQEHHRLCYCPLRYNWLKV